MPSSSSTVRVKSQPHPTTTAIAPHVVPPPVHDVSCNGCSTNQTAGTLYQCAVRSNYHLCPRCEAAVPQPYPMTKIYFPKQPVPKFLKEHLAKCVGCNMDPIVGPRYRCTERDNYDLCARCEATNPQPHAMIKIYHPGQAVPHPETHCKAVQSSREGNVQHQNQHQHKSPAQAPAPCQSRTPTQIYKQLRERISASHTELKSKIQSQNRNTCVAHPTLHPTVHHTVHPTVHHTVRPTVHHTVHPTVRPTVHPTVHHTVHHTVHQNVHPTVHHTVHHTVHPTVHPTLHDDDDDDHHDDLHLVLHPAYHPAYHPLLHPAYHPATIVVRCHEEEEQEDEWNQEGDSEYYT